MAFSTLSIKQKLLVTLVIAVLASTILVSTISQWIARDLVQQNVESGQLPNMVAQVANRVDKEVSVMKSVAQGIATNPDFIAWSSAGAAKEGEVKVVNYLKGIVQYNDLEAASFVDRETRRYWNQDGFLRVLQEGPADGWFFAYRESGNRESLSLYNEDGVGYRLFANYQQTTGRGMSGVAKSVDELVSILNRVKIAETGFVYLVDGSGTLIAHPDTSLLGKAKLAEVTSAEASTRLLGKTDFNMTNAEVDGETLLVASAYIQSAGWYVIAQVPEAELYAQLDTASNHILLWSAVIAVLFALFGMWLASSITRPIESLADVFQQLGKGEGDLTTRIDIPQQKETGKLVEGFNNFIASLHATISTVASTSLQLRESATEVADTSRFTQENSKIQRDHTIQVATALTELGSTVNEVAQSAQSAATNAHTANDTSERGRALTREAVDAIEKLSKQVERVANVLRSLDEHTLAIGSILDTIRGISEQTNLLALNAAIEAARAGDHGRGFSVVADEVRTLAQRAASATDEIQLKIDKFQQDSRQAVQQMQASQSQTEEVVAVTNRIDDILQQIAREIDAINDVNTQVATATEEQTVVVEDINVNIHDISTNSEDTLKTATSMVAVSERLDSLASELATQVARFKL